MSLDGKNHLTMNPTAKVAKQSGKFKKQIMGVESQKRKPQETESEDEMMFDDEDDDDDSDDDHDDVVSVEPKPTAVKVVKVSTTINDMMKSLQSLMKSVETLLQLQSEQRESVEHLGEMLENLGDYVEEGFGKTKTRLDFIKNEILETETKFTRIDKALIRNMGEIERVESMVKKMDSRLDDFKQMLEFAAKSVCG